MFHKIRNLFLPTEFNNYRPGLLGSNFLLYLAFLILIFRVITLVMLFPVPINVFFADITKTELLGMLNRGRQNEGLHSLTENDKLNQAAYLKAKDMIEKNYFSHISPEGTTPWFWISGAGYKYRHAGENLAIGFIDPQTLYRAWYGSVSHRENILNSNYTEIGTAIVRGFGNNNSVVVVQLFASPRQTAVVNLPYITDNNPAQKINQAEESQGTSSQAISSQRLPREIPQGNEQIAEPKEQNSTFWQEPEEVLSTTAEKPPPLLINSQNNGKQNPYGVFLNFIVGINSGKVFGYITYGFVLLLSVILLIDIFLGFAKQRLDLIFKTLLAIAALQLSTFLNEGLVSQIFPTYIIL